MTRADAQAVLAQLAAAFPTFRLPAETVQLWSEQLAARVADRRAAEDAVRALAVQHDRMPSLALLLDECRRYADRYLPPGLPEPEVTPEQAEDNIRRARVLLAHAEGSIDLNAALDELGR